MTATTPALDPERAAQLRRARRQATVLLAVVALAFLAVQLLPASTTLGYVEAMFEASLVGGLADWFAVVALFRHPLGLPIPHTAIIPTRKDQFGATLETFVRDQFLTVESVRERLEDPSLPPRLGAWLADPAQARRLAGGVVTVARRLTEDLDDERVVDVAHDLLVRRLRTLPMARMSGDALAGFVASERRVETVSALVRAVRRAVDENRELLRARLRAQAPWWVPQELNDVVFDRAEEVVDTFLRQVVEDEDHELRRALDLRLTEFAGRLREDPALADEVAARVDELAASPAVRSWVAGSWQAVVAAVAAADAPDDPLRRRVEEGIMATGRRLRDDPEFAATLQSWLSSQAPRIAAGGQEQVGTIIATTIDRWDGREAADQLEGMLGRDLQFVRINGTVVGGLVGLALHALQTLL